MPRKSRAKIKGEPASAVMESLNEQGADLRPASELPRQLTPPELTLEPLPRADLPPEGRELTQPDSDTARPRHSHKLNGTKREIEPQGVHTAAVLARRPKMQPTPADFMGVLSFPQAGIRVSKSHDKRIAAIQFSEEKLPDRAEKDILEAIGGPPGAKGFSYNPGRRHWERIVTDGMPLGENVIDAGQIAKELARGREERGR